jgi:L,D-transpeptidase ErfK/SrfK
LHLLLSLVLSTLPIADAGLADDQVMGVVGTRIVQKGESLIELARDYNVGFNEMSAANPSLDPFVPTPGSNLTIPASWIVPRAAAPGMVVVNVSEMRLYFIPKDGGVPLTFPVGVGMEGWNTPLGTFTVVGKTAHPAWYPPASIRRENPDLPERVPPGPDNPLGTHALRLSNGMILIHGTDEPYGVGRKASHGCIRLYPEDIPVLYERVPLKTRVKMVREPLKVGLRHGRVYVEVHDDPDAKVEVRREAARLLSERRLSTFVDARRLEQAIEEQRGIPVDVSLEPF